MENLYQKMLIKQKYEKEHKEKSKNQEHYIKYIKSNRKEYYEKNKEKQRQRAKDYYWKNREYVLERQRQRKQLNQEYYKQWYEKNKFELNQKRKGKKGIKFNYNSKNLTYKKYDNTKKKPVCFTLFL